MTPAELLALLRARGGCEFAVTACTRQGKGKRTQLHEVGVYRLTVRGDMVQASGPSGQTRQLPAATFLEVFGSYEFAGAEPTGTLTDLGPLFS